MIPALVSPLLAENSFPSGAIALVSQAMVAVVALGAVWLAVWIDRTVARRAHAKGPDAAASGPSAPIAEAAQPN